MHFVDLLHGVSEGILPSRAGRLVVEGHHTLPSGFGVCLGVGRWTALGAALLRGPTRCWVRSPTSTSRRPCQRVRSRSLHASSFFRDCCGSGDECLDGRTQLLLRVFWDLGGHLKTTHVLFFAARAPIWQFTREPLASGSFPRRTGILRSSGRRLQLASTMDTCSCVNRLRDAFRTFLREG